MNFSSLALTGPASATTRKSADLAKSLPGKAGQRITHSREQLTGTVKALVQKVHLPATRQARAKLPAPGVGRIAQLGGTVRRRPMPAVGVMLCAVLALRLLLRRTR